MHSAVSPEGERRAGYFLRRYLKKLPGLKSSYYLAVVLRQMLEDQWNSPSAFNKIFSASDDPWESTSPREQEKFAVALRTLASSGKSCFHSAVEIGCAVGIFTEKLAPFCSKLVALDFSHVALARARTRLESSERVTFESWDMRNEMLQGTFDLVVAMDVLSLLYRPGEVRRACNMIVAAIEPGGHLLMAEVRQSPVYENAWWGRYVLRGGEQIRRLLSARTDLERVSHDNTASHVFALFRKVGHR